MSEQYRYPPNDPFLQSRQSNVLHRRHHQPCIEVKVVFCFFSFALFLSTLMFNYS
ncbi:unnamed protein product, partial [Staurois parvus]